MKNTVKLLGFVITLTLSYLIDLSFISTAQANNNTGALSVTLGKSPSEVYLSSGSDDWVHYGPLITSTDRKRGVIPQIGDVAIIGNETPRQLWGTASNYSWADGTLNTNNSTKSALRILDIGNGFEVKVPADTSTKTLKLYVGIKKASAQLEAILSDGTTIPYSTQIYQYYHKSTRVFTLNYQAVSSGQTLTVRYTLSNRYDNNVRSYISLEAATLIGAAPSTTISDTNNLLEDDALDNSSPNISAENMNSLTVNPLLDLGLGKGKSVCFRLKSYNNVTESDFSKAICGEIYNDQSLTLSWGSVTGNVDGYYVYFGTSENNVASFLADVGGN